MPKKKIDFHVVVNPSPPIFPRIYDQEFMIRDITITVLLIYINKIVVRKKYMYLFILLRFSGFEKFPFWKFSE